MLRLPATATALVLAALFAYWLAGYVGAQHKLADIEPPPEGPGNYRITLAFPPERFHQTLLQDKGRLVEVRGSTVFMKDVDPASLRNIAHNYWVDSIERWSAP